MRAGWLTVVWMGTLGVAGAQTVGPRGSVNPEVVAPAAELAATTRTLRAWFAGYEMVPDAGQYARLGASLGPALRRLALDPEEDLVLRARAVSSLVHAPGRETVAALTSLADDRAAPALLRRKAVLVLGEVEGAAQLDRVVAVFEAARDDLPLREACARALRAMGEAAYAARATLATGERAPTVLGLLRGDKHITAGRPE